MAGTLAGTAIDKTELQLLSAADQLAALTGIDFMSGDPVGVLAQSLGVGADAVRRTLRSRGDQHIATLLPEVEVTTDLGAAISELGDAL